MFMIISKNQFDKLPDEYKQFFIKKEGGSSSGECRKNIHPT